MSYYDDERRRYRPARDRPRRDSYDDDTGYARDTRSSALVKRRESYDSEVDEVTRDFPPPDGRGGYIRETTIRKSGTRPARARSYDDDDDRDDYRNDRSYAGGRRGSRYNDDRRDRDRRRSSDYSSRSRSRTPPSKDRRKSQPEHALEALGLGGLAATLLGKKDRSSSRDRRSGGRDRARSEDRYGSKRRSKSRGMTGQEQLANALKAAVLAGAGEAFRARKEPGGWSGEKGKRVLTAAFSAGGVDGLISHNKDVDDHKTRNAIGSAIAGIATSRIVNGPRSKSRGGSPNGRGGRSQSRGGLGDLAAGGVVAAAAKKAYDGIRGRSQSRGRQDSRSRSPGDYSSRSPSQRPSRRRSVSQAAARGLAAVGLSGAANKVDPDRRRSRRYSDDYDNRSDGYRDDRNYVGQPRSGPVNERARSVSQPRPAWNGAGHHDDHPNYALDYGPHHNGDPETDSDSDLGSSTDEEQEKKKGKRKQLITSGLATVATIHAGHSVYQSYEKRQLRQKAVKEGKITREQAKQNRNRDRLQDAASVGLAALGIKGAYSEWKEMHEGRKEFREEIEKIQRHQNKRAARREKYSALMKNGGYTDSQFANSMPNLHSPQPVAAAPGGGYPFYQPGPHHYDGQPPYGSVPPVQDTPRYYDDNPYAASQSYVPQQSQPYVPQQSQPIGPHFPPPPLGHPQQNYPPAPPSTFSPQHQQGPYQPQGQQQQPPQPPTV